MDAGNVLLIFLSPFIRSRIKMEKLVNKISVAFPFIPSLVTELGSPVGYWKLLQRSGRNRQMKFELFLEGGGEK